MLCPKDNVVCDTKQLDDVEIDVCPKCDGVWIEQHAVRNLVRHLSIPEYSNVDELLAEWEAIEHRGTAPKDFWSEDKLACPREGAQMQKHYFAGSRIGVDHCLICKGFWLDGGELHAVAEYVGPSPETDALGRLVVRSWGDWEDKGAVRLADAIPVLLVSVKNPFVGLYLIGHFMARWVVERVRW